MPDFPATESWERVSRWRAVMHGSERGGWLILAGIALGLVVSFANTIQWPRSRERIPARQNLKQIGIALYQYSERHGSFPYDPRGGRYALYLLADRLPVSRLDSDPRMAPRPEAAWDHTRGCVTGADFEYANVAKPDPDSIVLVEITYFDDRTVMAARADGSAWYYSLDSEDLPEWARRAVRRHGERP